MNFNERLIHAKKAKGYTYNKLSEISGMPVSSLANWFRGENEPSFFAVMCLAKALDVSLDWLAWGRK